MQPNENPAPAPAAPAPEVPAPQPAPAAPEPASPPPTFTPGISNAPLEVAQPVEPAPQPSDQPAPAPQDAPQATPQPAPEVPAPAPEPAKSQTYDEYLASLIQDIPDVEQPKASEVDNSDPESLNKFFADMNKAAVEQAKVEMQKEIIIQQAEAKAWQEVFGKYPEVQEDQALRDTIHNIRIGAYNRGQSMSPVEAADSLIATLHNQYKKGINDNQVQTRIQDSQPLNGGGPKPAAPTVDFTQLQDGGRNAAVEQLQRAIEAGQI